ncbi:non-ribosomal peptide synthetase [Pseudomonas carnis]|uniref:Non-ribosomal peptide synthetase n=4 Tax=Gammaproteobacteria TaxID=1236 RepID=A0ABT5RNV1_9PSED|nr:MULTISPECIES: non-ribosomal peptide synthetase [Pseudomonas]MBA1251846.1 non-ribosomal peptide synthetase [Pseudomonas carnis]MBA1266244.1 non-ribosomal peptide synthetase [Pseudomonas carnis]MCP9735624.1 non-ribosomal peptide synthetase [Pseudomonas sp. GBPI_506]MDD1947678.1 non-ribosomal peptide synthetase [Pseudomonas carnis]CAH0134981.1 Gramicidin S synthase 2 [Pseudomonas carnis]
MQFSDLLAAISTHAIRLQTEEGDLIVLGDDEALDDALWDQLIAHKPQLLQLVAEHGGDWLSPAYRITPDMLALVNLDQPAIDRIVAAVPGGAANVQDIYPLAPLQEGMLYHHLSAQKGDPYVLHAQFVFDSRARLEAFAEALQWVIDRHDILRTSMVWERLDEPLQVVWRKAVLACEEVPLDGADRLAQLLARYDARAYRMDLGQAPLLRLVFADDPANQRVVAMLLFHHTILDHTALDGVRHEIQLYLAGQQAQAPAPVAFRSYIAQVRHGVSEQAHEAFFRDMLADIDEPTLPFGLQDVQGDGQGIDEVRIPVDSALSRRLRSMARPLGVSVASLMHLALARVLGAVSGREAVVFGTVMLGRMGAGEGGERALGMFINTLPLRVDVGEQGVRAAVKITHERLTRLLDHEHASLALAQRCSGVAAPTPLFSAILNYRHSAATDMAAVIEVADGIQVLGAEERTNYPLTLNVDDLGEDFALTVMVDASIGAQRVAGYLHTALQSLADALEQRPDMPLCGLNILPDAERHHLLHTLNHCPTHYADTQLIHQQVETHAAAQPDAIALRFEHHVLTYRQLNERANQVAHALLAHGVCPDARVAICVERGPQMIIGLLGILKAGAGYVPIDPAYPQERIAYTLADSQPVVVLVQANTAQRAGALARIDLDHLGPLPISNPGLHLSPANLAYVIYTSGSTGQPKGVMIEHRQVARLFSATHHWFGFNPHDVWALFHSFAFDFSVWEIWGALMHGGQLLIVPQLVSRSPDECYALLCDAQVSILNQTPSAFRQLIASQGNSAQSHSLRQVIFGGEALEPGMLKPWYARAVNAGTQLVNMYGITETTVHVTYRALEAADAHLVGVSPIGVRIPDLQLYVLDERHEPLPLGVVGELYVGGAGVARGYLNRQALNAERFLADPATGLRMYKTGDLGRLLADGSVEYLGRNDDQVKIRGFRIELGEIQAHLATASGVRDAVVIAREDQPGDKRLVAYVISDGELNVAALRDHLLLSLAEHMVPSAFVRLDTLPLTTNGKLDRKALPAPDADAVARREYAAPQGAVETTLAMLWQDLLNVDRVGREDNFFELGGHSLLAVKLIERMRQVDLSADVRVLFGQPTLAALAAAVGGQQTVQVPANLIQADTQAITPDMLPLVELDQAAIDHILEAVPGGVANVQDIYGLAPLQAGILYHHLATTEGDPYVLQVQLRFHDQGAVDGFVNALHTVIERNDILRTAILWEGLEEPVQVVLRQAPLVIERLDALGSDALEHLQQRFDPRHYRLDLSRASLMRLAYAQDSHGLVGILLLHHILLDHTALHVLVKEMSASLHGHSAQLPDAVQYRNYVAQARLGVTQAQHEAFFSQMLGDIDEPTLAFGLQDVNGDGSGIHEARLPLEPALNLGLREQARQLGVSTASLVHLAWAQVLGQVSGQQEVVFGTVLLGRMQGGEGADRALGMFINTLPLRVSVGSVGVQAGVRATHARLAQLLGHEHASLSLAQRCSGVPGSLPLFSTLLNYRHSAADEAPGDNPFAASGIEILSSEERSNYPLVLNVDDLGSGFALTVQGVAHLDVQRVGEYMLTALRHVVSALQHAPTTPLQAVSILPPSERHQVLVGFNATARQYPSQLTVSQLFEAQALARPEASAAVQGELSLSYRDLNRRANRLAHHLISQGVQPGESVAIALPRCLDLLVCQLAILKCAAVYVPLDVNAPVERQAFIVKDSGARHVLDDLAQLDLDTQSPANPDPAQSAQSVAYILYTSGSTGTPKGVQVPHLAISRLVLNNGFAEFNAHDRVAFASNPAFDASTLEVWAPLLNGGCVVVVEQVQLLSQAAFAELLREQAVSVLWMTAGLFHQYADALMPVFRQLRYLIVGGDVLDPQVIGRVLKLGKPQHLLNGYGPTEATTFSTTFEITTLGEGAIPIGRPIANAQAYVLDARQQPLPVGVTGELYIGGAGVAKGYLNLPQLSAEKFVPNPFGDGQLYRSGDLACWRADGNLMYLGRNDLQVKIRGFRIEPGEIEACLCACAGIRDVVVSVREDEPGHKRLVAYYTADATLDIATLRAHVQGRLPDYMVPSAYVWLAQLPLTANGKLDRKALPVPDQAALISRGYEAPQGEVESLLAQIWQDVLKLERVGRHDHFFELGGHSLLAVSLIERMRQVGLSADVRVLFSQPSLAALAAAVGSGREIVVPANGIPTGCIQITPSMLSLVQLTPQAIARIVASVPGGAANIQDIYPLAPLQEGILYHHISAEQGDPYLLQSRMAFDTAERLHGFMGALQQVVARHDILRTAVVWEGLESPVQVVWRTAQLGVHEVMLDPAHGDVMAQLHERFDARHYRLDITQAPLLRMVYAQDPAHNRVAAILLFHHLALDHTAMEVVGQEMRAFMFNQAQDLPAAAPFRNYVAQARLGVSVAQHEQFFRDMLAEVDEPTLPFGLQDVQGDGRAIEEAEVHLEAGLAQRVRQQARQLGVSAASLMHLAWAQVLGLVSGRDEVVFGTVLMGRMQAGEGADRALGMFINTLPLRVDIAAGAAQAVKATHARLSALLGHEHASLALAQRCSGVPTSTPLFSALLNYRHSNPGEMARDGHGIWEGVQLLGGEERSNYPLTLSVDDLGAGFGLSVLAVPQIGAQRLCDYMLSAVEQLVATLETAPHRALRQLPILPAAERDTVLREFNATAHDFPRGQTVHGAFEVQAERQPHRIAVQQGSEALTYQQLNQRANQLAHHLLELGVQADDRVALCCRRGPQMLVGLLGILKAGAGYVPIDPAYPAERIAYLLQDSAPVAVLAETSTRELLGPVAVVDLQDPGWQRHAVSNPQLPALTPAHLAYVIYTSGSTGLPKGVMVEHRTVENLVHWHCEAFGLTAVSHTSSVAGMGFDAMAWEVWPALCVGATLHLPPADIGNENIDELLAWWLAQPLDVSFLPTPVAEYAFSLPQQHPTLRILLIGGDRLRQFTQERRFAVVNNYGPTEATVVATSGRVRAGQVLHIGRPIANATSYVLDAHLRPVPVGVAGELYVGGSGVARGYLNRPELTAERFLQDPFNPGQMYRTGDLVRWLPDGNLEYLGRNDDQVKLRGVRVELGEIESRLAALDGIREAVVLVREGRLLAWFTEQRPLQIETLRAHLQAQLPEALVPVAYMRVDQLPLTANGKLDRKALPEPDQCALLSREYQAPQGDVETTLARLWAEVLQVEQVGRHDHFFELGGHSLLAVSLIERMRQAGLSADVRVLFSQPTLAALAAAVGSGREVQVPANRISAGCQRITPDMLALVDLDQSAINQVVAQVPGGAANVQDIYPLAPLQEGIFYHYLTAAQGDPYLLQSHLAFDGVERLQAFMRALQQVIDRHDILRTGVVWEGLAQPLQVVWRQAQLCVQELQLEGDVLAGLHERFDARRYRLEISQAPLIRLMYAQDPANQRVVAVLLYHHIVLDHTAFDVVLREMQGHLLGHAAPTAAPMPYRNYVAQARLGVSEQEHEQFFRQMLGDVDEPTLPFGWQDVRGDGNAIDEHTLQLDSQLNRRLRSQARLLGVSAASLFHLAWAQVLAAVSARHTVVFGTVLVGRLQGGEGADRALGVFINTLPLRLDIDDQGARAAVRATHARLTELLGHEHASLALAQRCSGVAAPAPLFSSMLNYRHRGAATRSADAQLAWEGMQTLVNDGRTNYPLTLNVDDLGDGYAFTALAQMDAQRVCGYMHNTLSGLVEALEQAPHQALNRLPVLGLQERQQLLVQFNATEVNYNLDQTLHGLFEAQVVRTPQAVAVKAGEHTLSYQQLNERANRLAHHLRDSGVRPDARVGICVERGLDMVVGLFAILKAGGAYVPLDPAYPPERIAYMLHDSAPVVVLAQSATRSLLGDVAVVDLDHSTWQHQPAINPQVPDLIAQHAAYVIYTSGSTGQPKGVINEHAGVVNRLLWMQDAYSLKAHDAVLQKTPFSFDVSVWEFFWPLFTGARLVMARPEGHKDPAYLCEVIAAEQITTLHFVPSMLDVFLAHGDVSQAAGLVRVMCSGEALPGSLVRRFKQQLPGIGLYNLYGPTEAAVDVTAWNCARPEVPDNTPIGKPIANTRLYVLDGQLQPVPLGVVGELFIAGVQVARGYLNRPELTAERFLDDPFTPGRMYRTGDLGRYLPDGTLEYLGRNDDQVKIRGLRIELGEIQARLIEHPAVKDAVVVARDQRLVAYYTGAPTDIESLRAQLLQHLPDFMVPALFMHLDALPLSPNGKLDRKALPAPGMDALQVREYAAPEGDTEILLAQLWAELLKVERVGRHDNFFELGGHSLLAVSLIGRLRQEGMEADVRGLFEQPTLAGYAAMTERMEIVL